MADAVTDTSRFLSLILRHKPETIGLRIDANGWADVDELIRLMNERGKAITRPLLERVVAENNKKRFAFSPDGTRIRASQGHSVEIDLGLSPATPPAVLYHGTSADAVASIRATGLNSGSRQHVHLSPDVATATAVGRRHGPPVVLEVAAGKMAAAGHVFYQSDNGVWLTDAVPVVFIRFPEQ